MGTIVGIDSSWNMENDEMNRSYCQTKSMNGKDIFLVDSWGMVGSMNSWVSCARRKYECLYERGRSIGSMREMVRMRLMVGCNVADVSQRSQVINKSFFTKKWRCLRRG